MEIEIVCGFETSVIEVANTLNVMRSNGEKNLNWIWIVQIQWTHWTISSLKQIVVFPHRTPHIYNFSTCFFLHLHQFFLAFLFQQLYNFSFRKVSTVKDFESWIENWRTNESTVLRFNDQLNEYPRDAYLKSIRVFWPITIYRLLNSKSPLFFIVIY